VWTKKNFTNTDPADTQPTLCHGPHGMDDTPRPSTPEGVFWSAHCELLLCDQGVVPLLVVSVLRVPARVLERRVSRQGNKKRAKCAAARMLSAAWYPGYIPDGAEET
jgi:hypothetical protein